MPKKKKDDGIVAYVFRLTATAGMKKVRKRKANKAIEEASRKALDEARKMREKTLQEAGSVILY
ncbi:hypothetical protein COW81_00010 [Candidatus Campbellbacteria bacterium CG22_combo_CG10-13_8_21_14_all_36_13]|uniref:Uncharacterized protein n=1 Tax=Candidatus Campbellbacteria bacterium CG22_combo_CG10-13_8_21_14_all_36_13 TaxID=1974529 RepID=A0A2H0DZ68_9BACT|nr:MAG: hypothetical protein COW81_00010 [Candidatus Campbellbacteria bacterium CG22_combo_CG10-13_8_21_14_all_36_13]